MFIAHADKLTCFLFINLVENCANSSDLLLQVWLSNAPLDLSVVDIVEEFIVLRTSDSLFAMSDSS